MTERRDISQADPGHVFDEAYQCHLKGDLEYAGMLYEKILAMDPMHADALHLSGVIAYEKKEFEKAENLILKAVSLENNRPVFHYNLGLVYSEVGKDDAAVKAFERAICLSPGYQEPLYRCGLIFHRMGDIEQAVSYYERALSIDENHAEIWNNLGNIALSLNRFDDAMLYYNRAVVINGYYAEAYNNMGNLHTKLGRNKEARQCYLNCLEINPRIAEAHTNLGNTLVADGDIDEALACYKRALTLRPDHILTLFRMGMAYYAGGEFEEALTWFKRVISMEPRNGQALQRIIQILETWCQWQDLKTYRQASDHIIVQCLENNEPVFESPFNSLTRHTDTDLCRKIARSWSHGYEIIPDAVNIHFDFSQRADKNKKIVIGYLSNNFRNHANAHLVKGLFNRHDRNRFAVHGYSYGPDDNSEYRKMIEKGCDAFYDLEGLSYIDCAETIYGNNVDILIDFNGYTRGNKMEICALRPSPVQIRYLGFPGSMQASFFDYIVTDRILTPEDVSGQYTEKFIYMPHCYQINEPVSAKTGPVPTRRESRLPEEGFVFASFNTSYKFEPVMFGAWMRILENIPGSVLWLLRDNPHMETNLAREAESNGISPSRLVFAEKLPKEEHLKRLALADLVLDTRIVGGHLSTSDALRAGVPVLTLQGNHFISRASSSILINMGLPGLVTTSIEDYQALAVSLATDKARLGRFKQILENSRLTSPVFDTPGFVRDFEKGLIRAWQYHCDGIGPQQIDIRS